MNGLVFNSQLQIRFKNRNWWFSLENPETTINPYESPDVRATDSKILPDIIAWLNFNGKWVAGVLQLF